MRWCGEVLQPTTLLALFWNWMLSLNDMIDITVNTERNILWYEIDIDNRI
jgi:hypothetical protein